MTVFQRTPQYALPARNRPISSEELNGYREDWDDLRESMRRRGGWPWKTSRLKAADHTPEERHARYEEMWERGGIHMAINSYRGVLVDEELNNEVSEFVRDKIRAKVDDPETARKLLPDYHFGTKRLILDNGYFETYNRDNVTLVDLREDPIERFTKTSVVTRSGEHPIDMLVLATGYDAISGSMLRLNPKGRGGVSLKDRWGDRFHNYLGMTIAGFPNLFMIHGPGSPGVFYNMPLGAERQMAWIGDCMRHLQERELGAVEPTTDSETAWATEVAALANATLFPRTDSWWTGANVEGKPRYFSAYLGGSIYYQRIADVAAKDYEGFSFETAR